MRDEYDIKNLNPRKNPYVDLLTEDFLEDENTTHDFSDKDDTSVESDS